MKIANLLIGLGLFALITTIMFSMISNSDGLYGMDNLNVSHDTDMTNLINNITYESDVIMDDFELGGEDLQNQSTGGSEVYTESTTLDQEGTLIRSSANAVGSTTRSYKSLSGMFRIMEVIGTKLHLNVLFWRWALWSFVIIVSIIFLSSVLRNALEG